MQLKENIKQLKPSATLAINDHSNELIIQGKKVYKLGFGQSPFPVPNEVVKELVLHAHEKDYLPVKGLPGLRAAISAYQQNRFGMDCTWEDVIVGPGSKELLYIAQLCCEGDLILPAPSWVSYAPQAHLTNKKSIWIDTAEHVKRMLDAEMLERTCKAYSDKKLILILNYPSNPTGASFSESELRSIADIARKNQILIISDEIYGELMHNGKHLSIARYYPEGTIVSSGISKWCGAGGWRLGTFTFPKELRWLLDAMAVVASETFTATSTPIQYAAVKAYEFGPSIEYYVQKSRAILKIVSQFVYNELLSIGLSMPSPQGGFYLFPDFKNFKTQLKTKGVNTSFELCKKLLEETGVALLPGSDFGQHPEELSARLSYVDFDGKKALALSDDHLDLNHIKEICPNVVDACEQIKNWLLEIK
ncbi:MAG TPA: aminotransferase class I/II-fold pyridoxal phosphate-dependent enzyme [Cyclobacteriaceae bacterium]